MCAGRSFVSTQALSLRYLLKTFVLDGSIAVACIGKQGAACFIIRAARNSHLTLASRGVSSAKYLPMHPAVVRSLFLAQSD